MGLLPATRFFMRTQKTVESAKALLHTLNDDNAFHARSRITRTRVAIPGRIFDFFLMMGIMGYSEKLQKLCAMRNLDQSTLATKVGLSKSSISRILSGVQEPKLRLAYDLARALGVTLDYLVDDSPEMGPAQHLLMVTDEEMMILKIVRRLGANVAIDRLLNVPPGTPPGAHGTETRGTSTVAGGRIRPESLRFDTPGDDLSEV
jgi:transcriptional regulator with XRE-family HTH domain